VEKSPGEKAQMFRAVEKAMATGTGEEVAP